MADDLTEAGIEYSAVTESDSKAIPSCVTPSIGLE
jgi:hypothetical protein